MAASCTGLYYRHMTEEAHRRTFVGTRTCIESRVKLECEKEQQEQLLLSVIPAYIAAEVILDKEKVKSAFLNSSLQRRLAVYIY